jgi:hypothetical protein
MPARSGEVGRCLQPVLHLGCPVRCASTSGVTGAGAGIALLISFLSGPACGGETSRMPSVGSGADAGRQLTVGEACNAAGFLGQGRGVQVPFTVVGAAPDHAPLSCSGGSAGPDLAFVWTAADSGSTVFEVKGGSSTDDLVLEIFRSSICDAAASVACVDDDGADLRPRLEVDVQGGRTYYVVVSAKSDAPVSSFTLEVQ